MLLYRIVPEAYLKNFSDKGASYMDGARWNEPGLPVLYFALSASVAMLEMANYFPLPGLIPKNRILGIYELPETLNIYQLPKAELPHNWNYYPHPKSTRDIGSEWLRGGRQIALIVPSAATPDGLESIIVINPLHSDIQFLKLIDTKDKIFNKRAFIGS